MLMFLCPQVQKMRWRVEPEEARPPDKPRLCCCITEKVHSSRLTYAFRPGAWHTYPTMGGVRPRTRRYPLGPFFSPELDLRYSVPEKLAFVSRFFAIPHALTGVVVAIRVCMCVYYVHKHTDGTSTP